MSDFSLPKTYKAVVTDRDGKTRFEEFPLTQPGKNQVLVRIEFTPINPADAGVIHGWYPGPQGKSFIGIEGSGVIVAVGEGLAVSHKVGDKVHVTSKGTWSQYSLVSSEDAHPIIDNVSLEEAASHIVNPGTVVQMADIVQNGGHKTAIHTTGSSALGRMMIRYFKQRGIKLINIVRQSKYVDELLKDGADIVLDSSQPDFDAKIKEVFVNENATIAFDAIAGDSTGKILDAMPRGSTLYIYGVLSGGKINGLVPTNFIFQKKTVTGLWLMEFLSELKPEDAAKFYNEVHKNLSVALKSNIQKVFNSDQLDEGLALFKEKASEGKILLKWN